MSVIERINNELVKLAIPRQLIPPEPVNYIPWTALTVFLSSLASERCVWKASDSPYYYWELSCHGGGSNDQANTSWEYCPYCGKRIEVKEADNG